MDVNGTPSSPIFCGFNGRLVAKNSHKNNSQRCTIKYDQYVRYLSLWFGEILGISTQKFKSQYGSQSGRSGGALAMWNAEIDFELWGQNGHLAPFQSKKRYMKRDIKALLSVSLAAMNAPFSAPVAVDKEIYLDPREDSDDSQSTHYDNSIPSMDGIPAKAFCWNG